MAIEAGCPTPIVRKLENLDMRAHAYTISSDGPTGRSTQPHPLTTPGS
jgi:hypothetical protein